ncbi:MAG: hypothetical protein EXR06_04010 [Rickettsiales bacterium]|nr:hypothetical protein [Rickettsiales bacterium]
MKFFKGLFVVFVLLLLVNSQFSIAAEDPYIVEDVAVSVSAKSPTEARNLAVKTVRRDAFAILLARLSLESAVVSKISDDEISDMVRSEQIIDEKIARASYSATFNVTFAKDFVEHVLAQKKLPQPEKEIAMVVEERPIALVIPVKILQRKILLWEGSNDWRPSISKALEGKGDFKVPVADIDNVVILNPENINKISASEFEPLFAKYQSNVVYFLLFSQDSVGGKASVTVRALSKDSRSQVKLGFANSEKLEGQELMNKVAGKTIEYLESLKANEAAAQDKKEQVILLEIPINRLGDWLMIKNKIENSGMVNKLNIEAISCDYVKASVLVVGADSNLEELFAKSGFALTTKSTNLYLLTIK